MLHSFSLSLITTTLHILSYNAPRLDAAGARDTTSPHRYDAATHNTARARDDNDAPPLRRSNTRHRGYVTTTPTATTQQYTTPRARDDNDAPPLQCSNTRHRGQARARRQRRPTAMTSAGLFLFARARSSTLRGSVGRCTSSFGLSPPLTRTAQQVHDSLPLWSGSGPPL